MRAKAVRVLLLVVAAYLVSYAVFYARREPAANLAYFAFTKPPTSETVERGLYRFYWPAYKIHRLLGGQPHVSDRPPPVDVPNA